MTTPETDALVERVRAALFPHKQLGATLRLDAEAALTTLADRVKELEDENAKLREAVEHAARIGYERGAEAEVARLREEWASALRNAEHLFQMVPEQVWRDSGGDDGQGHYEGEYHAAELRDELTRARAALTEESK